MIANKEVFKLNIFKVDRASFKLQRMNKNSPFRQFETSPKVIRLSTGLYVYLLITLCKKEDWKKSLGYSADRFWDHFYIFE